MPGGLRLTGCTSGSGGAPPPAPLPSTRPPPPGPHAPSCLSLGARGALALALGTPSGPLPVPWVPLPVTHALACLLAHRLSLRPMHLGALPAPLRALPVPWPLPGSLPLVAPSAARALSPSAAAPLPLAACALARSLRVPLCTSPVASCPPLRAPVAGTQLCLHAVPSFLDHTPGVPLPLQLRQRDTRQRALGRRGADVPRPPRWEGLWGERLGGTGVGVGGVGVGAVLRALPAHCCCRGSRRRGACGRCGDCSPLSGRAGGRGVAGRGGGAARRGRGRKPSRALPAIFCGCGSPQRCAWFLRRGYPPCRRRAGGRGRGRAWLAGAAVSAPPASGAPNRGGATGLVGGVAGAVTSAGSGFWVDGPVSAEAARGCPAGGPTSTAASASLRSSRSAGVSPAQSGEMGERERDRRWWRSFRWGEPSESAITVILVGMRGGRCALPTTTRCISVVPWAVPCSALRGGGGEGLGGWLWPQPRTGGGRRPSIGIGRGGGGATRPTRRATAPSLGRGSGPWALGGHLVVPGGAALGGPP